MPVAELVDALDRIATAPGGEPVRDQVVTHHPLQTVDERAFTPGALGAPGPFSFDVAAFRGARAGRDERVAPGVLVTEPLPIPDGGASVGGAAPAGNGGAVGTSTAERPVLDLDELVELLEHPAKWFVRRRLGVQLLRDEDEVDERLPLSVGPLDSWAAGDRILTAVLAGAEPRQAFQAEWRRGQMPPRQLGNAALLEVMERIRPIHAMATEAARMGSATGRDVLAEVGSVLVAGTVPGVHSDRVVRAEYSKLGAKHRLRAWVQLLALATTEPDRAWHTVTIGRGESNRYGEDSPTAAASRLRPPEDPAAALADLVALHIEASRMPLPIPPKIAERYATARSKGAGPDSALAQVRRGWRYDYQADDPFHLLCFGDGASLESVAGTPSEQDRERYPEETTRLGALARRVWDPLLASEERITS
ncbi:hypothetical protein [Ruania alba]|uniref:hypothetical protein n=1 Tax=Ruania alba TaxID=648782 RepID=UPI003182D52B